MAVVIVIEVSRVNQGPSQYDSYFSYRTVLGELWTRERRPFAMQRAAVVIATPVVAVENAALADRLAGKPKGRGSVRSW